MQVIPRRSILAVAFAVAFTGFAFAEEKVVKESPEQKIVRAYLAEKDPFGKCIKEESWVIEPGKRPEETFVWHHYHWEDQSGRKTNHKNLFVIQNKKVLYTSDYTTKLTHLFKDGKTK